MPFDFPLNPTDGTPYTPPGGPKYVYYTPSWQIVNDGSGDIEEAPNDGQEYVRKSLAWVVNTGAGIPEAPIDGKIYGRKSIGWTEIVHPPTDWTMVTNKPATFPPTLPIAQTGVTNLVADLAARVLKAGSVMTGHLTLPINPAAADAVRRDYVDAADATINTSISTKVPLAGGTMTGFLNLHADPTGITHAATKRYVDAGDAAATAVAGGKVSKIGDTMTGPLLLPAAAPSNTLHATHKQYVDTVDAGLQGQINTHTTQINNVVASDAAKLPLAGGNMTGLLVPKACAGGVASDVGSRAGLEIRGDGVGAAFIAFHRPAALAAYFGLDTDHQWVVGGWSYGNTRSILYHTGNLNPAAYLPIAGGTITGALAVNGGFHTYSTLGVSGSAVISGTLSASGNLWVTDSIQSNTGNLLLGAAGSAVYLRPHGTSNAYAETVFQSDGGVSMPGQTMAVTFSTKPWVFGGLRCKNAASGDTGVNFVNFHWNGSPLMFIDDTYLGVITISSDYRIKKDVTDLPSMWETVKKYRPIKYTHQEWWPEAVPTTDGEGVTKDITEPLIPADDIERWGFIAHELQAATIPNAATGEKDQVNCIQSPNPWTMLAALTKTLQEAQARIEALEGAS